MLTSMCRGHTDPDTYAAGKIAVSHIPSPSTAPSGRRGNIPTTPSCWEFVRAVAADRGPT